MPMNSHTSFVLFGGFMFTMASTFLFIDQIPVRVTLKPKYSIYVCPKKDFPMSQLSPLSLIFVGLFPIFQLIVPIIIGDY